MKGPALFKKLMLLANPARANAVADVLALQLLRLSEIAFLANDVIDATCFVSDLLVASLIE